MINSPEIIVGTNEEFLLSYKLKDSDDGTLTLVPSFTNHSHFGSIRQVAVNGKHLVSGGTDEHIRIFNLNTRKEEGIITEHEATINCLKFHGTRHLFSASADNKICVFQKGSWQCNKTLLGHTAPIMGISIHPSGKLALSVSQDKKLMTWNLIKGRKAFTTNLKEVADSVHWSLDGTKYAIIIDKRLDLYEVSTGTISQSTTFDERIQDFMFIKDSLVIIGGEEGNIYLYDIEDKKPKMRWSAHKNRIKCLSRLNINSDPNHTYVISGSSDGFIKIWKFNVDNLDAEPKLVSELDTSCRVICMTVYYPSLPLTPKESTNEENKEEEMEDESNEESSSDEENVVVVKAKSLIAAHKKRTKKALANKNKRAKQKLS